MKSPQTVLELDGLNGGKMQFHASGFQARQDHSKSFPDFILLETGYLKVWCDFSHMETGWTQLSH